MTFTAPRAATVLAGLVRIPTSKPHTQRALLLAALASGESTIRRPNVCSESEVLRKAAEAFGARFTDRGDSLVVHGVGGKPRNPASGIQVAGSGFALRHLLPIAALAPAPCSFSGDRALAARPIKPLLVALESLGSQAEPADSGPALAIVTRPTGLAGGQVEVPAHETSQFVSGLMLTAPYADGPVRIRVPGVAVSRQYIRLTCDMMTYFGATVIASDDLVAIDVQPGGYQGRDILIGPDVTSLFYFIAAAIVVDADIVVRDVVLGGDAFLESAVTLGGQLGARITQEGTCLRIASRVAPGGRVEIDARDIPTLVPALAAVASSLPNGMLLHNASHIQHHKTSRLQVVLEELGRMGRVLRPHYRNGQLDGFETDRVVPSTVDQVDGHGDHRNFMALRIAAMAAQRPVHVRGAETLSTSFADFEDCFRSLAMPPAGT